MAQATKLFDLSAQGSVAPRSAAHGSVPVHSVAPNALTPNSLPSRSIVAAPPAARGAAQQPASQTSGQAEQDVVDAGPRKLVRPRLPEHLAQPAAAPRRLRGNAPLARHEGQTPHAREVRAAASHAETLYFQKQMQTQTPMVFVLEDGEKIEGIIEWFDRDTIKIRNRARVLLYKRTIKYLYKAGEPV